MHATAHCPEEDWWGRLYVNIVRWLDINECYSDPNKTTDQKEWAQKLMDEKGVACKDYK